MSVPKTLQLDMRESKSIGNAGARAILVSQAFVLIYFQKFMLFSVSVTLTYFIITVAWLLVQGHVRILIPRIIAYGIMMNFAIFSQLYVPSISILSLTLFGLLTVIYAMKVEISLDDYLHVLRKFSLFMLIPAFLVFVQYVFQLQHGTGHSLSLDPYVPSRLLLPGYIAEASKDYWVVWNRPNGMVFLEPSFCSAFLACAAIVELQWFKRYFRLLFFVAALVATNGGTGWVILAIAISLIGFTRHPALTVAAGIGALVLLVSAQQLLSDLPLFSRLSEFDNTGSSGYGRLILPFATTLDLILNHRYLFTGNGAGQITVDYGSPWPITKIIFEYGILTACFYFILVCMAMFRAYDAPLWISLFVVFQFTGGYLLSPFMAMMVFILCLAYQPPGTRQPFIHGKQPSSRSQRTAAAPAMYVNS